MPLSAHDVARELRGRLPGIGTAKLQKLLYYCQGWHLAANDEPMFAETIEAWAKGPVVATLWADEQHDRPIPDPQPVGDAALATIDYVIERYGRMSGEALIHQTHREEPWRSVTEVDDAWAPANPEIGHDSLRAFFSRDGEYVARTAEVERLRARHMWAEPATEIPGVRAAVERARSGERVRQTRPA